MEPSDWLIQLRKGTLELCTLALLAQGEQYGYDLVQQLNSAGMVVVAEGTIYPLLRRLSDFEYVGSSWHESPAGPPRKYYKLTVAGRAHLNRIAAQWGQFSDFVNRLIGGDLHAPESTGAEAHRRVPRASRTRPLRMVAVR